MELFEERVSFILLENLILFFLLSIRDLSTSAIYIIEIIMFEFKVDKLPQVCGKYESTFDIGKMRSSFLSKSIITRINFSWIRYSDEILFPL